MIVCRGPNDFDVHMGEEFVNRLCWDEMLGQIVHLTHPQIGKARYGMTDVDRYQLAQEKHLRRMHEIEVERNARTAEEAGDSEAAIQERAALWRETQHPGE